MLGGVPTAGGMDQRAFGELYGKVLGYYTCITYCINMFRGKDGAQVHLRSSVWTLYPSDKACERPKARFRDTP